MVMKKNRCPPESTGCEAGKKHLDIAVPGYDDVRYSTGQACQGNPAGTYRENIWGMTYDSSSSCSLWHESADNTQDGCDCSDVTADHGLRAGCQLFTDWGWKASETMQLSFQVVDCPAAFTSLIASAFSADGPSDGSSSPTPSPTPSPSPSGDFTYGDDCGTDGCSDCDEGCQWSWPSDELEGYDGDNAACRCNPDVTSVKDPTTTPTTTMTTIAATTITTTPAPATCEYTANGNTAVKNRGTGGKKLKRKNYGSKAKYLAACQAACNADSSCGGFVDDKTDRRGRMCKPKKTGSVGYSKKNKAFYVKGSAC